MADRDFEKALDWHVERGLELLDLRDCIYGKSISELTAEDARRAATAIEQHRLSVYCFSTSLFSGEMEVGEKEFRRLHLDPLTRVLETASILKPRLIRLIAAQTARRRDVSNAVSYMRECQPWLLALYREAIDRIHAAGFQTVIENEVSNSICSTPREILEFFDALGLREKVSFTWDVANLWQMGTFPTLEVYTQIKHLIGYVHVKGGMLEDGSFIWASALEDASWPVAEILNVLVADGVSPVICLNPPHGRAKPGYDISHITSRDLQLLRQICS
jgi:hypothetical protein